MHLITIAEIDLRSPYLAAVKALGKAYSGTLGLFPEGAFEDHAAKRWIIAALDAHGTCVGYLLYRVSYGCATIVHLCVDVPYRGHGVAHQLLEALKQRTTALRGVRVRCRRDYPAHQMWPRLGFVAVRDDLGRGRERKPVTIWWLDHGHATLLTAADMERLEAKLRVVMDANVFFDLQAVDDPESEESQALLADWLQADVELCIADELLNEINRNSDRQERERQRAFAQNFTRVQSDNAEFDTVRCELDAFFPKPRSESDESDLREIARTIAAHVQFFVTRDTALLDKADGIYQRFGLSIIRPTDLIIHLDALRRETEYQPVRFAGTVWQWQLVQRGEQEQLIEQFARADQGETRAVFQRMLWRVLADPQQYECWVARDDTRTPLALIAYDRQQHGTLGIPVFRLRHSTLGPTLARYLILRAVNVAAREQRVLTRITDPHVTPTITIALQQDAFVKLGGAWVKPHLAVVASAAEVAKRLLALAAHGGDFAPYYAEYAALLDTPGAINDVQSMVDLERIIWPAKIANAAIPTFIVPIRAHWAHELFDEHLATQTLFGARPDLALNREAAYYRAVRPAVLTAPARILWYVSQDERYNGAGSIRACSRLDEVLVGKPKVLFRQFRRLGVYTWANVFDLAKHDVNQEIMALRFSNTELFTHPIALRELRHIFEEHSVKLQLQSPSQIKAQVFAQVYQLGMRQDATVMAPSAAMEVEPNVVAAQPSRGGLS